MLNSLPVGSQKATEFYAACAIEAADVVMTIGYDMVEYPPSLWNSQMDKCIIHADFLPAEIDYHYHLLLKQQHLESLSRFHHKCNLLLWSCGHSLIFHLLPVPSVGVGDRRQVQIFDIFNKSIHA